MITHPLRVAALAAVLFTALPLSAASPKVDVATLKAVTKQLASDDFEGRGPSTTAEPKVIDYIIAQFKAAGLKPGNHGGWLQDVPVVEITPKDYSGLTITGGGKGLTFQAFHDFIANSYRVVDHTDIKDSELVFVGYGINAPELGWNDYAGTDMHGKIAVILINDPDYADETETGLFKGRRMTYYGRWTYKFEEAARQGAKGALIIHDTFPAAYGWNVLEQGGKAPVYHVQSANDGADQTEVNGWIQKPVAEAILTAAGQDLGTLTKAAQAKGFHPVPLGLKASLSFTNTIHKSLSHNVIGILPGKAAPDEYVLYSAHWDHFGHCAPGQQDTICNGAVDNATGVAALVELARENVAAGPARRSEIYAAWTMEEMGLLGSEWYGRHPAYPLAKTVGGVNIDMLIPGGRARNYAITGGDKSDLNDIFRAALAERGLSEEPEDHPERGHYYRSDHFSLAKQGVPVFDISRGTDLEAGGEAAGKAAKEDFNARVYHQTSDEYSDGWDMSGILQDEELYYALGRRLADGSDWPNWRKGDEFRAIRDASRSQQGLQDMGKK